MLNIVLDFSAKFFDLTKYLKQVKIEVNDQIDLQLCSHQILFHVKLNWKMYRH